jgi:meso-butanediol dehydrogenase / (S,S)-butanediol dehydrogenase / diacetyl reductase
VTRLAGKVALITGGATGIGRACARRFASEGATVAILGRRKELLGKAQREIQDSGGEAFAMECDVTESGQVNHAVQAVAERFGALHVVVNNAGVMKPGSVEETSDGDWNWILSVNLTGTFFVSRAAIKPMRASGGGSIINMSSVYGLVGMPRRAAYAASKGGVTLLTRAMALDHVGDKIRVNCICPALVETEIARELFTAAPDPEAAKRARVSLIPAGRAGTPEEIAGLAAYLASDESAWMTGAALPIDGGQSAG